jgi:flagellar biosynthetic protein FliR
VTSALDASAIGGVYVFCRIGACLMLLPVVSSVWIPSRYRLALALWLSAVFSEQGQHLSGPVSANSIVAQTVITELGVGIVMGVTLRACLTAGEFLIQAAFSSIGFSPAASLNLDGQSLDPPTLLTVLALTMGFVLNDAHVLLIRAFQGSYSVNSADYYNMSLIGVLSVLKMCSQFALALTFPVIVFSILGNLFFGFINRMAPVFPSYFISAPFLIAGAFLVWMFTLADGTVAFVDNVTSQVSLGVRTP